MGKDGDQILGPTPGPERGEEKAGEEEEEQGDDEKEGRGRLESEEEEWGEEGEGRKARRRTMGRKAAGCGGGR